MATIGRSTLEFFSLPHALKSQQWILVNDLFFQLFNL